MKLIPLTQGKSVIVDDADFARLNKFKWFALESPKGSGMWYARRNIRIGKKRTVIHMHRDILNLSTGDPDADHRNRNGLDNRRENLRLCTDSQNMMNRVGWSHCGYKGVSRQPYPKTKPWCARIRIKGREIYLGFFSTPIEAAKAYNQKALELFGEFARLNPV